MGQTYTTRYFIGALNILCRGVTYQLELPSWSMVHHPNHRSVEIFAGLDDYSHKVMKKFICATGSRLLSIRYAASLTREGGEPAREVFHHDFDSPPHIKWIPTQARFHVARGLNAKPLFRTQDSRDAPAFAALPSRPLAQFIH